MFPSSRLLLLATLWVGACACSTLSSARRTLREGEVTLRFAWPERFSARVDHTIGMSFSGDGSGQGGHRSYWWRLEPDDQRGHRRLIARDAKGANSVFGAFADPEVTVVFDREGTFLEAVQPENAPGEGMLEALPLEREQQEQSRQTLGAVLQGVARERWEQRVGRWRGVTLAPGETQRRETKMWLGQSFIQREEIEAEERTSVELGVPCHSDEEEQRCVRVIVETVPLRQYHESDPCERARGAKRFELVTDPQTLLPYQTLLVTKYEMDSCAEDGTVHTRKVLQAEEFVFTYGVEPASPSDT